MINVEVVYCSALITKMTLHRMCYETMTCILGVCSYLIHMSSELIRYHRWKTVTETVGAKVCRNFEKWSLQVRDRCCIMS